MKIKLLSLLSLLIGYVSPVISQVNQYSTKDSFFVNLKLKTSATSSSELKVYNWFENKSSATVLTFDDFSPGHPAIGIPYLIEKKLPGTFFVTTGNAWRTDDYAIMENAVTKGIEIANHTVSHQNLKNLGINDPPSLVKEINDAYTTLNTNVTNQSVYTFAYPLGEYSDDVISVVQQHHIAARTVEGPWNGWTYDFALSEKDYFTIRTKAVNPNLSKDNFAMTIEDGIADGGLVTFMIHSIYSQDVQDSWFDAIPEDYYSELLDTLAYYADQTWITTFSNAVRYHKEANSSTLAILSNTKNETILSLTDTLSNNSIYNQPLSIYYKPTIKSVYTGIKQNDVELPFNQSNGIITFNAIPDGGSITLTKDPAQSEDPITGITESAETFKASIYPMPSRGTSTLEFAVKANDIYSYKVIDLQGKIISNSTTIRSNQSEQVQTEISIPVKGVYLLEIHINDQKNTLKLIIE